MVRSEANNPHGRTFREVQGFPKTVFLIIAAIEFSTLVMTTALFAVTKQPWYAYLAFYGCMGGVIALLFVMRLRVVVDDRGIGWNWMPFGRGRVRFDEIETVEVEKVDAMGTYGGWGPKYSFTGKPRSFALVASGPQGVRIMRLEGKRHTVITSHRAEELATAILERLVLPSEANR